MISQELLDKHNLLNIDDWKVVIEDEKSAKLMFYDEFLKATDYIPNKLVEAQVLGIECKDYSEELAARQYAREQINLLRG